MANADHLFISYASEDGIFADWLARKLTAEGYLVWFDRLKLLGGESYPKDIDKAIKESTFRLIALLSRNSIQKANPVKERTLALNVSRERNIDFLVPLNVDGLKATELDWMTSDLTFIPFQHSWQAGLAQLLAKLKNINAPRSISNGRRLAALSYGIPRPLHNNGEDLISNIMPVSAMPRNVYQFRLNVSNHTLSKNRIDGDWAYWTLGDSDILSFQQPPSELKDIRIIDSRRHSIEQTTIGGLSTPNVIKSLLYKSVWNRFIKLGCRQVPYEQSLYFPRGLLQKDKIEFISYTGKKSRVVVTSTRSYLRAGNRITFHYHLCPSFKIRQDLNRPFCLQLGTRLFITDNKGEPLPHRSALTRRKNIAKSAMYHVKPFWARRRFGSHPLCYSQPPAGAAS